MKRCDLTPKGRSHNVFYVRCVCCVLINILILPLCLFNRLRGSDDTEELLVP